MFLIPTSGIITSFGVSIINLINLATSLVSTPFAIFFSIFSFIPGDIFYPIYKIFEGLYLYGSGEMDQLSPIKEEEKYSEIYDTKIPLKIPLHFISEKEKISKIKCGQMFTMILSTKGNVYTFGCADNGGIGHED